MRGPSFPSLRPVFLAKASERMGHGGFEGVRHPAATDRLNSKRDSLKTMAYVWLCWPWRRGCFRLAAARALLTDTSSATSTKVGLRRGESQPFCGDRSPCRWQRRIAGYLVLGGLVLARQRFCCFWRAGGSARLRRRLSTVCSGSVVLYARSRRQLCAFYIASLGGWRRTCAEASEPRGERCRLLPLAVPCRRVEFLPSSSGGEFFQALTSELP